MSSAQEFPVEILESRPERRLDFFKNYTVAHPRLLETDRQLRQSIQEPASKSLIFVYGPTGVGKTTMLQHVERELMENVQKSSSDSPSKLLLGSVEAPASESGNFRWKDFYIRALKALDEPFIDDKIDFGNGINRNGDNQLIVKRSTTKSALRRSLENALEYREPEAFLIDEAQHLTHMSSGRRLRDQLECLKSLANISQTTLVLIGTYDLLAFRNMSGQLSRRSIDIHFPRYLAEDQSDAKRFQRIIKSFQLNVPLKQEPDLLENWNFLYERSMGCVGILKDWITITYSDYLQSEKNTLDRSLLENQALSVSQCEKIMKEIRQGERELKDSEEERRNLRRKLGLDLATEEDSETDVRGQEAVGVRNPKRDSVGMDP